MQRAGRVTTEWLQQDALAIAPEMLRMQLVRRFKDGKTATFDITEVEVYRGEDDLGCHASKGRTSRTEVMYLEGGRIYVYLIYGMYWLLNITTGPANHPQAILIRGTRQVNGPGRVGRALQLDKSFYGEELCSSDRLWLQWHPNVSAPTYITLPRIGIDYAGAHWATIPWRFLIEQ